MEGSDILKSKTEFENKNLNDQIFSVVHGPKFGPAEKKMEGSDQQTLSKSGIAKKRGSDTCQDFLMEFMINAQKVSQLYRKKLAPEKS